ncbi:hypothetical protein HMPREF1987_01229 [Peptostreptococcaceae bacterium oral taxon 113 str. W5053]|nr:hypothetical protein HMPREF1987_01229 [Peptostreptococcaceae bacterium oral taxon 113 str. W5053]
MQVLHQTVHSTNTDVNAIITCKDKGNLVSPQLFFVIRINLQNLFSNLLIFFYTRGRNRGEVLIVGAAVYSKNSAKSFNIMLETELMNSV